jgi:nucleoid DNA-binding protein
MNKTQLTLQIAKATGLSKNKSRAVLKTILSEIAEQTFCHPRAGVQIEGFGEFRVIRGNHSGSFNLATGKRLTHPGPVLRMSFRPDPDLRALPVSFKSHVPEKYIGGAGQPVPNSEYACL